MDFVRSSLASLSLTLLVARATGTTPPANDLVGAWLGEVTAPNATTEIGFAFEPTTQGLMATFYMPAMAVYGAPLGPVELKDGAIQFAPLATILSREGAQLVGTFGLAHLPVVLRHGGNFLPAPPPPEYPRGPDARWSIALAAKTWASPVVRDGMIYLGTVDGKFHSVDSATGRARWTWPGPNPLYGNALVDERLVWFLDQAGEMVCLDRETGTLRWRTRLHGENVAAAPAAADPTFNHRWPAPVLVDGALVISHDDNIYRVDPANGTIVRRDEARAMIFDSAGVDRDRIWFGGYDGSVFAVARDDGTELARTRLPGAVVSTPIATDETIVVGARDYMLYGLRRADLSVAWRYSFWFSWVESTPTLVDGTLYIGGSDFARITALNPRDGRARWSTPVHGLTWGTPVVTDDTVYAGTSAQSGALIAHVASLVALDRRTGAIKWRNRIPFAIGAPRAGFVNSLALAGDVLIAAGFDGTLAAYPIKPEAD
jgi:outer membrane protein assembly factor BamB